MISDEAVEAAAVANYEARTGKRWSDAPSGEQAIERSWMRRTLDAAAPHMQQESQAAAWDEGYLVAKEAIRLLDPINPYRSQA